MKEDIKFIIEDDKIIFKLKGNATTGYNWKVQNFDEKIIKLCKEDYIVEGKKGMCGVGGIYEFTFQKVDKGNTTIEFAYGRSWESEPIERQVYTVTIGENNIKVE